MEYKIGDHIRPHTLVKKDYWINASREQYAEVHEVVKIRKIEWGYYYVTHSGWAFLPEEVESQLQFDFNPQT